MRLLLQKLGTILAWPAGACSNLESDFIFIALLSLLLCYLIYLPTTVTDACSKQDNSKLYEFCIYRVSFLAATPLKVNR